MKDKFLKKVLDNYKKIIVIVFVFFIFFATYRIVPMMYDGWASKYYYADYGGLVGYSSYVFKGIYNWMNGRISSNIVCGFLESFPTEIPLDLFNAGLIIGIILCVNKILKNNNKKFIFVSLLFMSIILLTSEGMRTEVLFYANSAYITPVFLILLYYILYKKVMKKYDSKAIWLMCLFGIIVGTWMEHIAVGFAVTISIMTFYLFIKKNSIKWKMLIPTLVTNISTVIMCMAPGLRRSRVVISNSEPLINIIKNNLVIFYNHIISRNLLVVLLLSLFGLILVITNKKIKKLSIVLIVVMLFLLVTSFGVYVSNILNIQSLSIIHILYPASVNDSNFWIVIIMIILILTSLLYLAINSKNRKIIFYLLSAGIFSLAPMSLTPNSGERISFIGFIILAIIILILYSEINIKERKVDRLFASVIIIITIMAIDKNTIMLRRINDVNVKRSEIIREVIKRQELNEWNYDEYVVLPIYKSGDVVQRGAVVEGSLHYLPFLKSNGLSPETKVLFSNSHIIANSYVDGDSIICEVLSSLPEDYEIKYIVQYTQGDTEFRDIENTGWVKDLIYSYKTYGMVGYYKFEIYVRHNNIEQELDNYIGLYIE